VILVILFYELTPSSCQASR